MKSISSLVSLCLCGSVILSAVPARAIELSLEENRAERGSVGYVDMQRLFKASPDASRAREGLEELVRQAEERVNTKKADLLRLRQELGALKVERDEIAKSTPTVSIPAPAPAPVIAKAPAPKPAPKPAVVAVDTTPVTALPPSLPRHGAIPLPAAPEKTSAEPQTASTQTTQAPLTINLPGLTEGPLNLERPGGSPLNPTRAAKTEPAPEQKPAPDFSSPAVAPAAAKATTPPPAPAPALPEPEPVVVSTPAVVVPAGPTLAQRLLEYDGKISAKQLEIDRLQSDLDHERLSAERTLLDAEGRKTDQVLARLYRALSEVAKREGVSVVVDKSTTLYGHPAVDLTDKVLKQLRGVAGAVAP